MLAQRVTPTVITFNTLLDFHCRRGNMTASAAVQQRMTAHNIAPDEYTVGILVRGWVAAGDLVRARTVLEEAGRSGTLLGAPVFNALLDGHCRAGAPRVHNRSWSSCYTQD